MSKEIIVVGGGPAGLFAAIAAAESGCRVTLLEKHPSCGRKLLASGGGRCNLTNTASADELAAAFGREGRFTLSALRNFDGAELREWFDLRGVPTVLTDSFHYFPASGKAGDLLNALTGELHRLSVKVIAGETVTGFEIRNGAVCGVKTASSHYRADAVIFATGGRSYPALSGGADAYPAAADAGHTIVTPLPAMTNLVTQEDWCGKCAGISLPDAESWIDLPGERKRRCRGDLLFTKDGVSAFAVLDHAGRISELLQENPLVPLRINLFAGKEESFWRETLERWRRESGKKLVAGLLAEYMPRRLAEYLIGGDGGIAARMSAAQQKTLITSLTALPLQICGTGDWSRAMVTRGGVSLREVSPRTLESRLIRHLYFAGEVLDLDGPCGGYNLTWAFSSGRLAGESAAAALMQ